MEWNYAFHMITFGSLAAWTILILAPRDSRILTIPYYIVPLGMSVVYGIIAIAHFPEVYGAYSSLESYRNLASFDGIVTAGWMHLQILNLFFGSWIVMEAGKMGMSRLSQAPILLLTLFFAPLGFLAFKIIRVRQPEEIFV